MALQTLESLNQELQQLCGQEYDSVKHEMAIRADSKQRYAGQKEGFRQKEARENSGQDTAGQFETDLIAGGANSTLSAGLQIVGTAREAIGNSDPGAYGDCDTIESAAKSQMYNEGVTSNDSSALGDIGLGMTRIQTEGDFPITYVTDNVGQSLNSSFNGATSTLQAVETAMETTIQLTRTLNLDVRQQIGNTQALIVEAHAQQAQNPGFGGPTAMGMNLSRANGPKGYTTKPKEESNETNWAS